MLSIALVLTLFGKYVGTIKGEKDAEGIHWYKVEFQSPEEGNDRFYTGYINGQYFTVLSEEEAAGCITEDGNGKYHVDLKAVNAVLLKNAGLPVETVTVDPECTYCLHEKYWSHRYTRGVRGSQGAIIVCKEAQP